MLSSVGFLIIFVMAKLYMYQLFCMRFNDICNCKDVCAFYITLHSYSVIISLK
jgi:hypothetical protein